MKEQEKWIEEAWEEADKYYLIGDNISKNDFIRGYLQACRKRQEEANRIVDNWKNEFFG